MENSVLQLSLLELLSLLGLVQTVYVIVHLVGRAKNLKQIFIPCLFFLMLTGAFTLNLAESRWRESVDIFYGLQWFSWAILPSISALFIVQIIRLSENPPYYLWGVPFIYFPALFIGQALPLENNEKILFLNVSALIIGAISLLIIWIFREGLSALSGKKSGKERFWTVMALITMNIGLLSLYFIGFSGYLDNFTNGIVRAMLGLGFVYLGATSLFRIYPHTIDLKKIPLSNDLSDDEEEVAEQIENLLRIEKIYQEPGYNRTNLARELNISETQLSKIVRVHFDKTVPQLLNVHRVQDAQSLLLETKADIATITYESGFNSVATFNRVFKEIVGISPTAFRKNNAKSL